MTKHIIKLTWVDYEHAMKGMVSFLRESGRLPQLIVGIARGGLVPMATLSHRLGVRSVGLILRDKTASDEQFANDGQKLVRIDGSAFRWEGGEPRREILRRRRYRGLRGHRSRVSRARVWAVRQRAANHHGVHLPVRIRLGREDRHGGRSGVDFHAIRSPGDSWIEFP